MDEKPAHLPDRLELGHIGLEKNTIDRAAGQRHVVAQQRGIIGHGVALLVWNTRRLHRRRGPHLGSPLLAAYLGGMRSLATTLSNPILASPDPIARPVAAEFPVLAAKELR